MTSEAVARLIEQACSGEAEGAPAWHGPSLVGLVGDLTAREAAVRWALCAHTIWEIVVHIAVWDEICVKRLEGELLTITTGSPGDWPAVDDTSEAAWEQARARLLAGQRTLIETVRTLPDDRWQARVPGWPWTNELMVHGTLHHDVYHAGQIAVVKRAGRRLGG